MLLRAYAKINLALDVLGRRADGYHEVRMVMQTVGMYDRVRLAPLAEPGKITLETNLPYLPTDENNLAVRAARLLMEEAGVDGGLEISLAKFIPVSAGLAGGSTDAAAVMTGVNRLFHLGLSREALMERGLRIGADVPFCILQGTALAEGIGERLTPLPAAPPMHILLCKPPVSVSTKEVYGALDAEEIPVHPDIDGMMEALEAGDVAALTAPERMYNVLEPVTAGRLPVIREICREMTEMGALRAVMSGSGPTVFGIFDSPAKAEEARSALRRTRGNCRIFLTEPYGGRSSR